MSVSTEHSVLINLYCNETFDDSDALDTDIIEVGCLSSSDFPVDHDESFIDHMFDSELDQIVERKSITRYLELPDVVTARQEAVNWMLKVHTYYQFRPETAYLSINYMDRFLSSHSFPEEKGWSLQLLAVACLSIAAKLEETRVPLIEDMQILEPRFLFKPITVQRMELLAMASLKWRLHVVTPLCFLQCFIARVSPYVFPNPSNFSPVISRASDIIVSTCGVINLVDYAPSTIAAAAVLLATNRTIDDTNIKCFHKRVNVEMVKRCYNLMKLKLLNLSPYPHRRTIDATTHGKCQERSNVTSD